MPREKTIFASQEGSFFRNALSLSMGTMAAQALSFAAAPLITRLYTPADLGTLAIFISISGILSVVSCLCFELSVVLPDEEADASGLFVISIINSVLFSSVVAAALFFLKGWIVLLGPELQGLLWLLPIYTLSSGALQALSYWCTRKKYFKRLAASRMAQSLVLVVTQVGLGLLFTGIGPGGLVTGYVLGVAFALAALAAFVLPSDSGVFRGFSFDRARGLFSSYRRFSLYSSSIALVNISSHQAPVLMLGFFFEAGVLGFYSLGYRVLSTPMMLCGSSVAQVFFSDAVEKRRNGGLSTVAEAVFHRLFTLSFIPTILLLVFAPDVFSFVFGVGWRVAGVYAQFLLPAFFLQFISSPLSHIFYVLDMQHQLLNWNAALLATRLASILAGAIAGDAILAVMLLGLSGIIMYAALLVKVLKLCEVPVQSFYPGFRNNILFGLILGAALALLGARFESVNFSVAAFALSLSVFLIISFRKFLSSARGDR